MPTLSAPTRGHRLKPFDSRLRLAAIAGRLLLPVLVGLLAFSSAPAAPAPSPPSEVAALAFAYQSLGSGASEGDQAAPPDCSHIDKPVCIALLEAAAEQKVAILRADYRVGEDAIASLWLELWLQSSANAPRQAPEAALRITLELEFATGSASEVLAAGVRILTNERRHADPRFAQAIVETALRGLAYRWLRQLEQPSADAGELVARHVNTATELHLNNGVVLYGREPIQGWLLDEGHRFGRLHQRVSVTKVAPLSPRHYHMSFAVDWQGTDQGGWRRIGRTEYRWKIALSPRGSVHITHIEAHPALPLPNTGARIFC